MVLGGNAYPWVWACAVSITTTLPTNHVSQYDPQRSPGQGPHSRLPFSVTAQSERILESERERKRQTQTERKKDKEWGIKRDKDIEGDKSEDTSNQPDGRPAPHPPTQRRGKGSKKELEKRQGREQARGGVASTQWRPILSLKSDSFLKNSFQNQAAPQETNRWAAPRPLVLYKEHSSASLTDPPVCSTACTGKSHQPLFCFPSYSGKEGEWSTSSSSEVDSWFRREPRCQKPRQKAGAKVWGESRRLQLGDVPIKRACLEWPGVAMWTVHVNDQKQLGPAFISHRRCLRPVPLNAVLVVVSYNTS